MSIVNNRTESSVQMIINAIELIFSLIFPGFNLKIMPNMLLLTKEEQGIKEQIMINNDNFQGFKQILKDMFCLNSDGQNDYNPANKKAEQIAKKLRDRKKKLSKKTGQEGEIDILSRYISILSLGNCHTIPQLMNYTVFQLFNEFQRFEKKYNYDIWFKAKLAGAQNLQDVSNWMTQDETNEDFKRPTSGRIEF